MSERPRVAVFSELPTPYRWPVFEKLLQRPEIDLRVFYCARREKDRDWAFDFRPDERVRFLPVTTISFAGRRTIHYHVNPTVFGELRRGRFDVVVFPGYAMFASQFGALWCRATGTPYAIFSETTHLGRRRGPIRGVKRLLLPGIVGGASAWLATGVLSREYLVSYGAREEAVFSFPNTPDVGFFRDGSRMTDAERRRERARHGAGDEPVVLFVARLIGVKRCDVLIDAVARLREQGRPVRLWVAGDGTERAALERRAAERGVDQVTFFGNVATADLPRRYGAADVFVLPSDHEPWGAVVGEALACGLPAVVSDHVGSAPDLVVDGENGAVFPRGDAEALAAALDRVLSDPAERRRMGDRSAERSLGFTHEACVEAFLDAVHAAMLSR